MDVDWFARGIGLTALIMALSGLALRYIEFRRVEHADLKVVGSAGAAQGSAAGSTWLVRSPRTGYALALIDVINRGRRRPLPAGAPEAETVRQTRSALRS